MERPGIRAGTGGVYNGFQKRRTPMKKLEVMIMYFEAIAKIIAERTGCDISAVKPESTFTELGIEIELEQPVATVDDLDVFLQGKQG